MIAMAAVSSPIRAENWPMHRHDPAHTATTAETLKLPLKRAWTFKTGAASIVSSASVVGNTVYFGTRDRLDSPDAPPKPDQLGGGIGSLYAVDAASGKPKWRFNKWKDGKAIGWVDSTPAVVGDRIYFAARDNHVYCISTSGAAIWRTPAVGMFNSSSPTVVNGKVYLSNAFPETDFICLRASDGQILWRTPASNVEGLYPTFSYTSPAVVGGTVYTAATNGIFYALNAETGSVNWKFPTSGEVFYFSPTVYNGRVYCAPGARDPHLYAVDMKTGKEVWRFQAPNESSHYVSSPAAANGTIYIGMGVTDAVLYAVDAQTGKEKWRFSTGVAPAQGFISSPAVAGGLILVGAGPETALSEPIGRFFVVNSKTGKLAWRDQLASPIIASPTISGHRVFVGTTDGTMVAYGDATLSTASPKTKPPAKTRPKTGSATLKSKPKASTPRSKTKKAAAKVKP
ncbi:MAG: PQQ-binding-like beta-propeller repeat protein [Armatimonadetes bacterium]|nr:PQQ-binding-like beta-propeller repeat protein [Armatimonadota bacterium]